MYDTDTTLSEEDSNESLASLPLPDEAGGDLGASLFGGLAAGHSQIKRLKLSRYESDSENSSQIGDTAAGEAPSESLELLATEVLTPAHRRSQNRSVIVQ